MELQKASGYLKNAYYQGHGRYVNQIVRMTLKFCKNSGSCRETRKFIETRLVDVARVNPGCVIYVKPRLFRAPVITAEYLNGERHSLGLYRMSSAQVEAWMSWFLTRSGNELYRLHRHVTTHRPSVQGIWNPFYFRDHDSILTEFPSKELGRNKSVNLSASEQLIELSKQIGFREPDLDSKETNLKMNRQA